MDYQSLLYDPIYNTVGVAAILTLNDSAEPIDGLTVVDKTTGVDIGETVEAQVIVPAAIIRAVELAAKSVTVEELPKAKIEFNEKAWLIVSYRLLPSPNGEADGEVFLLLEEAP